MVMMYIRLIIASVIFTILLGIGYFVRTEYNDMQNTIQVLTEANAVLETNNATLDTTIETLNTTIDEIQIERNRLDTLSREMFEAFNGAEEPLNEIKRILSRHNLEELASERPALIERRINDGTENAFRSFEFSTGSR